MSAPYPPQPPYGPPPGQPQGGFQPPPGMPTPNPRSERWSPTGAVVTAVIALALSVPGWAFLIYYFVLELTQPSSRQYSGVLTFLCGIGMAFMGLLDIWWVLYLVKRRQWLFVTGVVVTGLFVVLPIVSFWVSYLFPR